MNVLRIALHPRIRKRVQRCDQRDERRLWPGRVPHRAWMGSCHRSWYSELRAAARSFHGSSLTVNNFLERLSSYVGVEGALLCTECLHSMLSIGHNCSLPMMPSTHLDL